MQQNTAQSSGRIFAICGLIVLAALSRLLPHPPNFSPITAMALFGAVTLFSKRLAYIIPLVAMLISDLALGVLHNDIGYAFHSTQIIVYACFLAITFLGLQLTKKNKNFLTITAATVASSLFFFVVSNLAVWLFGSLYLLTVNGLAECFAMAVPFYQSNGLAPFELVRNAFIGDAFYTSLIFGAYYLVGRALPSTVRA